MNVTPPPTAERCGHRQLRRLGGLVVAGALLVVPISCGSQSRPVSGPAKKAQAAEPTSHSQGVDEAPEAPLAALLSQRKSTPPPIKVTSTSRGSDGAIGRRYTCREGNVSPAVEWRGVPRSAKELFVVVDTLQRGSPIVNWAVAGLDPALDGIAAGELPAGAILGRNSFGKDSYRLCPVASSVPILMSILVIALPRMLPLHRGFDAGRVFEQRLSRGLGRVAYLCWHRRSRRAEGRQVGKAAVTPVVTSSAHLPLRASRAVALDGRVLDGSVLLVDSGNTLTHRARMLSKRTQCIQKDTLDAQRDVDDNGSAV